MFRPRLGILAILSLVLLTAFLPRPIDSQEILPGIHLVHGTRPGLPNTDLEAFGAKVGDATVVGLGESVHTSGGYSQLKFRLFKYLVEEKGFRAFAFESPWEAAELTGRYVETCQGSSNQSLTGLFGVWQNQSVHGLVRWMCRWNRLHPDDPVIFFGFDVQQPGADWEALNTYFDRVKLSENDLRRVRAGETCLLETFRRRPFWFTEEAFQTCLNSLDGLGRFFDRRHERLERQTSPAELEMARLRLLGLRAFQEQIFHFNSLGVQARDGAMAEVFLTRRRLEFPGIKIAIWAHNFHINELGRVSADVFTMGDHLQRELGEEYRTIALIGHQVSIDWPGIGCGELPIDDRRDSVERMLHELGQPALFADFAFPGTNDPFLEPGRRYWVNDNRIVPRDHYDAAFFLDVSPKMKPLRWEPCVPQ